MSHSPGRSLPPLLLALSLSLFPGCATFLTRVAEPLIPPLGGGCTTPRRQPRPFTGTRADLRTLQDADRWLLAPFALIDLPLSFMADSCLWACGDRGA